MSDLRLRDLPDAARSTGGDLCGCDGFVPWLGKLCTCGHRGTEDHLDGRGPCVGVVARV